MMQITNENFRQASYDVFQKFTDQYAIVTAGDLGDFNCMTLGWGMMGNVWGHPGPALTIYVQPSRYTFEYMQKNEYFTVSFLPGEYHEDARVLGRISGRDGDKIAHTHLHPVALSHGVGYEEAELTFVCKKICAQQFDISCVPDFMKEGMYKTYAPHYFYIGAVVDAFGEMKEWNT